MVRENEGKLGITWPVRELSCEQEEIKNEALNFAKSKIEERQKGIFVIGGQAGTGKSVLVTALFNEIQAACKDKSSIFSGTNNYVLVNHPEMLKFYKRVAGESPMLLKKTLIDQRLLSIEFIKVLNKLIS